MVVLNLSSLRKSSTRLGFYDLRYWVVTAKDLTSSDGNIFIYDLARVRFHYGHPDVFDRLFHITRGGISKASAGINLSEDIFAGDFLSIPCPILTSTSLICILCVSSPSGFNSTLRRGYITHHEYIQVGKGRDVGLNQISLFEAKVACGNGEQILSREIYRLGHRFDFFRMLSCYYTTVGFYISSMVIPYPLYLKVQE